MTPSRPPPSQNDLKRGDDNQIVRASLVNGCVCACLLETVVGALRHMSMCSSTITVKIVINEIESTREKTMLCVCECVCVCCCP